MVVKCQEVPVFHPTWRDVNGSWEAYIESIERRFANVGLAKIIPPKGWTPRKTGYKDDLDYEITRPIRQHATGKRGLYRTLLVEQKPMSLAKDFRPQAVEDDSLPPAQENAEEVERRFWRNVTLRPPLYGADVPGSLFDHDLKGWNLRRLDSLLSRTLEKKNLQIPGVSTPYLYFGMWRSIFAWHTEDMDLASVNYLHYGAPKAWYCIPPAHRDRFERLLQGLLPDMFRACPEFFRHKELLVSPYLLLQNNIPVVRCVQYPGEFIINYPGAYHSGFNHGYNCAESTNFATKSWIAVGVNAGFCECQKDSVAIQMSLFMSEAAPRVRRMIREAEASSSEDESDSDEDLDNSSSGSGEDSGSDSEEEERLAKPRKNAAAKKPLVTGGRGMAAVSGGPGRPAAKSSPASGAKKVGRPPKAQSSKAAPAPRKVGRPRKEDTKPASRAAPAKKRALEEAAAAEKVASRPRTSRKPVGTPSRAVGKRAASLPARLRPHAAGVTKRAASAVKKPVRGRPRGRPQTPAKDGPTKLGRPPKAEPSTPREQKSTKSAAVVFDPLHKATAGQQKVTGNKRSPVSANLRSASDSRDCKRLRTESATSGSTGVQPRRRQASPVVADAAKAAAAKRVVQRARQPQSSPSAAAKGKRSGQVTMLGRVLKLTAKAAETAKNFLGGGATRSAASSSPGKEQLVVPACTVRLVPREASSSSPGTPVKSTPPRCSPRQITPSSPSKSPVPRVVPRRPRSVRVGGRTIVQPTSELAASPVRKVPRAAQKMGTPAVKRAAPKQSSRRARNSA